MDAGTVEGWVGGLWVGGGGGGWNYGTPSNYKANAAPAQTDIEGSYCSHADLMICSYQSHGL